MDQSIESKEPEYVYMNLDFFRSVIRRWVEDPLSGFWN